ncbi:MAG: MFS transporter [Acidobacteriota bacterium]|nr:MFS transporter [Acidobacteriota bacterium]
MQANTVEAPVKLFNRNFILLLQGQVVSQIGSQAYMIAIMFWIKQQTGSASLMGTYMMVTNLPGILLGPIGGTFADRFSRRNIMIVSDLVKGLALLGLGALFWFRPEASGLLLTALFAVSILSAVMSSFFRPAMTAAIPDLVPKEMVNGANGLNQAASQIAMFFGQAMGGVLFRLLGAPLLIIIDAISFLLSALSESFIRMPRRLERKKEFGHPLQGFWRDTVEGFRYVWDHRGVRALFLTASVINFTAMPFLVLAPFYVEDVLRVTVDWYGYILAAYAMGSLAGFAVGGSLKLGGKGRMLVLLGVIPAAAVCFGLVTLILHPAFACAMLFGVGLFFGVFNVNIMTLLQLDTPEEMRGRVLGLLMSLFGALMPVSMGIAGWITDLLDQNVLLVLRICSLALMVTALIGAASSNYRNYLAVDLTGKSEES